MYPAGAFIKKTLNHFRNNTVMRVAMATVVALLILNFVDEHFNDARYTRARRRSRTLQPGSAGSIILRINGTQAVAHQMVSCPDLSRSPPGLQPTAMGISC